MLNCDIELKELSEKSKYEIKNELLGKPLYYIETQDKFICGTNLIDFKSYWKFHLNKEHLAEYMKFRYVTGSNTLIEGIKKFLPGETITVTKKGIEHKYELEDYLVDIKEIQREDYVNELKNIIRKNLESINPENDILFLSGGVDSSLIAAMMFKEMNGVVDSISAIFPNDIGYSEIEYMQKVYNEYSNPIVELEVMSESFADNYLKAVKVNGEPLNFPNSVVINILAEKAKELGYKGIVVGEGCDELFAGYDFFKKELPMSHQNSYMLMKDVFELSNEVQWNNKAIGNRQELVLTKLEGLKRHQHYVFNTYLQTVLNRLYKQIESYGLDIKTPLYGKELLDFSFSLPDEMKVKNSIIKYIIKQLAQEYYEPGFVYRPKVGFSIPINKWLRDEKGLGRYVGILTEPKTFYRGIYNKKAVLGLVDELWSTIAEDEPKKFSIAGKVWILLNLEMWCREVLDNG